MSMEENKAEADAQDEVSYSRREALAAVSKYAGASGAALVVLSASDAVRADPKSDSNAQSCKKDQASFCDPD